jgi:hypothetical protein
MSYKRYTLKQRPELEPQIDVLSKCAWPVFLLHGNSNHWDSLFLTFADFQILLCDPSDKVIAIGHTVPLVWDGTPDDLPETIDGIVVRAIEAHQKQQPVNTFSALAAIVAKEYLGQGLSTVIVREMRTLAVEYGCYNLIAPVRPIWKKLYPLTPMENYVQWKREDGAPFDPWIRVHWRLGAEQLRVVPNTLTVKGSVAEWEEWAGMSFPESGKFIVPGALQPVSIDRECDFEYYEDANIWMKHPIQRAGK